MCAEQHFGSAWCGLCRRPPSAAPCLGCPARQRARCSGHLARGRWRGMWLQVGCSGGVSNESLCGRRAGERTLRQLRGSGLRHTQRRGAGHRGAPQTAAVARIQRRSDSDVATACRASQRAVCRGAALGGYCCMLLPAPPPPRADPLMNLATVTAAPYLCAAPDLAAGRTGLLVPGDVGRRAGSYGALLDDLYACDERWCALRERARFPTAPRWRRAAPGAKLLR